MSSLYTNVRALVARSVRHALSRRSEKVPPGPLELAKLFDRTRGVPEVLQFGDSVAERISWDDVDRRTLGQMVSAQLGGRRTACVSHQAYQIRVYHALFEALLRMRSAPMLLILPINLRSFSPQWDLNPRWQFGEQINAARAFRTLEGQADLFVPRFSDVKAYQAMEVEYPLSHLKTIGEFHACIGTRRQTEEEERARRREIFVFHYCHPWSEHHPKLTLLRDLLHSADALGTLVLMYVTPVNMEAGVELVGEPFRDLIAGQVETVRAAAGRYLNKGAAEFADWSDLVPSSGFFHAYEPTEHLNQHGRKTLAEQIGARAVNVLDGANHRSATRGNVPILLGRGCGS